MDSVRHQTILTSDITSFDRIDLKSQCRTTAGVVMDLCVNGFRIKILKYQMLYRDNGMISQPFLKDLRSGLQFFTGFLRWDHGYAQRLQIIPVYDRRFKAFQRIDIDLMLIKVFE